MEYHRIGQSERRKLKKTLVLYLYQKRRQRTFERTITIGKSKTGTIFSQSNHTVALDYVNQITRKIIRSIASTLWKILYPVIFPAWHYPIQTVATVLLFGFISYTFNLVSISIFADLPSPSLLNEQLLNESSKITDRDGKILFRVYESENRTSVPLSEISPFAILATIAIEDKEFYIHNGFSFRAVIRALLANSKSDRLQGGSTITQQLVKNRLLTSERTIKRKIKEILLAIRTETMFSKEEILTMYLNQVPYGGSTYGIEEAAQRYFGKPARYLDLAESALLAGIPAAPSAYSPYGSNPEKAFQRQAEVLKNMVEAGFISPTQASEAQAELISFKQDVIPISAPHFVMYVKSVLAQEYGEELVTTGGLFIKTTLDSNLQKISEEAVKAELEKVKKLKISNGAALVTQPSTGEILAMVGSVNYFDFANDGQVNIALRQRQPGSSIKPLTYSLAFQNGFTPASIIQDTPITFTIQGSEPYSPRNYDGTFRGTVTLRQALASSYNVPAVKLLSILGVSNLIDYAEKMGISTWTERSRFGLSLTLGGGEVTMMDMATAYGVFANLGKKVSLNPILEVRDSQGALLYQNECALHPETCYFPEVISPGIAYQLTHVLKDPVARIPGFGPLSVLTIPNQEVAVKTGTTNNLRDNWTIGYTTDRLVVTWVGNNDNSPMSYVASGITGASPIWNSIIRTQLSDEKPHVFARPDTIISLKSCFTKGEEVVVIGQPLPPPCREYISENNSELISP